MIDKTVPPVDSRSHPFGSPRVYHADVYYIFAPQRYRQDSAVDSEHQPGARRTFFVHADAPSLIELAVAVGARIGGVVEQVQRPFTGSFFDPFAAGCQCRSARLKPQPFERRA